MNQTTTAVTGAPAHTGSRGSRIVGILAACGALALLVFVMHRANIARLIAGTESKIGQSAVKP